MPPAAPSAITEPHPHPDNVLGRLVQVGASHPAVRRCSRARRHLLPRSDRVVLVTGRWAHEAVLRSGAIVECLLWCPCEQPDPQLARVVEAMLDVAREAHLISARTLARVHPGLNAPALVSLVRLPRWRLGDALTPLARLVLVADGVEYAGNLGTLIRTADACAADAVLVTNGVARLTQGKAFVASRGTVLTMPTLEYASVAAAVHDLQIGGFTVYAADPSAPLSYLDSALGSGPTAVVVGSEGRGLSDEWRTSASTAVSIPMRGHANSLNVAASAAVLMYEARARLG